MYHAREAAVRLGLVALLGIGCDLTTGAKVPPAPDDADADADADSDSDMDADADSDSDTDADADADSDTDTDTDADVDTVDTAPGCAVPGGDLLITEVMDFGNTKFVELYNANTSSVDLATYELRVYANGNTGPSSTIVPAGGLLAPCGTWVLSPSLSDFSTSFGFAPDEVHGGVTGNGNDVYELVLTGSGPVDVYGEIGVDGVGTPWDYEDASGRRDPAVTQGSTAWNGPQWQVSYWTDATPKVR
jgi:hypothetical protein